MLRPPVLAPTSSVLLALAVAATACSKPKEPVLTPKQARVTSIDATGAQVNVRVDAYNPNDVALSAKSVTAHILLDGKDDLGTATIDKPVTLPPQQHIIIEVPLAMRWKNVGTLAGAAAEGRSLPYVVDGKVNLGGRLLEISVPFRFEGRLTQQDLLRTAIGSIPGLQIPVAH